MSEHLRIETSTSVPLESYRVSDKVTLTAVPIDHGENELLVYSKHLTSIIHWHRSKTGAFFRTV